MFRATMCPSSGETPVFMRHLVLVILHGWLSGMQGGMKLFLSMFISFLYMFWATMWPSSGEAMYLCDTWYLLFCMDDCLVCRVEWNSFLECLFLFSTCFGRLCAHHQEKQLYLCNTWYLLFCMDDCLVYTVEWKLCTKLALFTRLYKDVRSTKH
jgi:hypothetical protein